MIFVADNLNSEDTATSQRVSAPLSKEATEQVDCSSIDRFGS